MPINDKKKPSIVASPFGSIWSSDTKDMGTQDTRIKAYFAALLSANPQAHALVQMCKHELANNPAKLMASIRCSPFPPRTHEYNEFLRAHIELLSACIPMPTDSINKAVFDLACSDPAEFLVERTDTKTSQVIIAIDNSLSMGQNDEGVHIAPFCAFVRDIAFLTRRQNVLFVTFPGNATYTPDQMYHTMGPTLDIKSFFNGICTDVNNILERNSTGQQLIVFSDGFINRKTTTQYNGSAFTFIPVCGAKQEVAMQHAEIIRGLNTAVGVPMELLTGLTVATKTAIIKRINMRTTTLPGRTNATGFLQPTLAPSVQVY